MDLNTILMNFSLRFLEINNESVVFCYESTDYEVLISIHRNGYIDNLSLDRLWEMAVSKQYWLRQLSELSTDSVRSVLRKGKYLILSPVNILITENKLLYEEE